jgi:hypothetical protein
MKDQIFRNPGAYFLFILKFLPNFVLASKVSFEKKYMFECILTILSRIKKSSLISFQKMCGSRDSCDAQMYGSLETNERPNY